MSTTARVYLSVVRAAVVHVEPREEPRHRRGVVGDLRRTLTIAIVGHALALAPFARSMTRATGAPRVDAPPEAPETFVELEPSIAEAAPGVAPTEPARASRAPTVAAGIERTVVASNTGLPATGAAEESNGTAADATPPAAWFSPVRGAPVALGLGTSSASDHLLGPPAPPVSEENGAMRAVKAGVAERERAGGIARGGPIVTAVQEAASGENAPHTGTTIFEVDSDANGVVTSARSEDGTWSSVADGIVRAMRGKTVRVSPGASGLRTRVRVIADLQRPSGEKKTVVPGAVPDDVPGSKQPKKCVGEGWQRKCYDGMIVGFTATVVDANNFGAAVRRAVHVTIVGETDLR